MVPLLRRNLDALDFFKFLDARLHLFGFGRLIAEAVDEGFQLLDALALIAVGGFKLGAALVFLTQVRIVISAVEMDLFVPDFDRFIDRHVQEIAVVRDQDIGEGIIRQILTPASCALPDPGDWWARPATACWVFRAGVSQARCASASRPKTPRCAASNPPCETRARRARCPPAPRSRSRRDCGIPYRCDASGRPPRNIRGSPDPARRGCDAAFRAPCSIS